ncbi:MAG: dihydrodipicolinate synthase family protein [Kiritimatiellae bacterium]|nr:dihydrodipicolinate synthase family protein [Kiritimatiellia bacterium]
MEVFKEGLFPATVTPFGCDGAFDSDKLVRLMERNLAEGAAGFLIGGSSAECFLLTREERVAALEVAAAFRGRTRLIAHVGALATGEACVLAREAARLGYHRVAATPPFYYKHPPSAIRRYYERIAEAAGMPVVVYNFPGNTGVTFDLRDPEYAALFSGGAVCGVKHTSHALFQMERFMALYPDLQIYNGYDETMICAFAYGARASIGSTFNCMLGPYERLRQAILAGDVDEARRLQHRCNDAMEAMCRAGLFPSIKYVLERQGCPCGNPREPLLPLGENGKKIVDAACAWLWTD